VASQDQQEVLHHHVVISGVAFSGWTRRMELALFERLAIVLISKTKRCNDRAPLSQSIPPERSSLENCNVESRSASGREKANLPTSLELILKHTHKVAKRAYGISRAFSLGMPLNGNDERAEL